MEAVTASKMMQADRVALYEAWREMDSAALSVTGASVANVHLALVRLEAARVALKEIVWRVTE